MQQSPFYGLRAYALPPDGGGRVGAWAVLHDGCGGALEGGAATFGWCCHKHAYKSPAERESQNRRPRAL